MERVEREGILWLVEKMIEDNNAELAVHRHRAHHQKMRDENKKFEAVARYYRGELWLEDREERLKLEAALTSGDTTQEEVKETDGSDGADDNLDDTESDGNVADDESNTSDAEQ